MLRGIILPPMLFNSIEFFFFLPVVFALYWFALPSTRRARNLLLVVASYVFYGWWDPRFLLLILFSSLLDFEVGRALDGERRPARRKGLLALSLAGNLGLLGLFKYHDFFARSLMEAAAASGFALHLPTLQLVLPVGISFYTFQTLSYTLDVHRGRLPASHDRLSFLAYVSFFPQLVAGPIERATHLLGQFGSPRIFHDGRARDGLRQMLWGFFKKLVVADRCAPLVQTVFQNHGSFDAAAHWLAMVCFAMQLYCDFSGYSDIAIGSARLFGFDLRQNFATPFFSRSIGEFWRRWHISLSTWFRDYLFIPLGGLHGGPWRRIRNTFVTFGIIGLWHGANWTFVVWGLLNAVYSIPGILPAHRNRETRIVAQGRLLPGLREVFQMSRTFFLASFAAIFFRSPDLTSAIAFARALVLPTGGLPCPRDWTVRLLLAVIAFTMLCEWIMRERRHALEFRDGEVPLPLRWIGYLALIATILLLGGKQAQFIYFQF